MSGGDKQIQQMVEFIKQEANEKAEELREKTEQEFNIQKLELIEQAKLNIREEYRHKQAELVARQKIEKSTLVNKYRLDVVKCRNDIIEVCRDETKARIQKAGEHPKYAELLTALIVQAMLKLVEKSIKLRVKEEDKDVAEGVLSSAMETYSQVMLRDTGLSLKCKLQLDKEFLPKTSAGGVMLLAHKRKIVVDNTLDRRLDLAFDELKPVLREYLF